MEDAHKIRVYKKKLLWVYAPDYQRNGAVEHIPNIPNRMDGSVVETEYFWE